MKKLFFLLFFIPMISKAMPEKFEVWFLSTSSSAKLDNILGQQFKTQVAQARLQCQPMGDYCFDPQVGLYKRGEEEKARDAVTNNAIVENKSDYDFVEPAKSVERNLVDCEKGNFFDIFCGKSKGAKKSVRQAPLEVWVDVSSTMKQVDFEGFDKQCKRESFLRLLGQTCPLNQKMKVYTFEEYRKEAGSLDRVCLSGGLNNMNRIMDDIKKSQAKKVIIITDIFEASEKFINQIEMTGVGTVRGVDKPIYAKDLTGELKRVRKFCL